MDGQDRIRAAASLTVEELRKILADVEASKLPTFDVSADAPHRTH